MTIHEALNLFKDHEYWADVSLIDEACEIAIEAIKKQIPQKPILSADGYADGELVYDIAECPNCGHELDYESQEHHCVCGQAIDWSGKK